MNENATKARIKSKTGIDCVIAWLEPRDEDDFSRKVKASAVRIHPPVGSGFWDVAIELDDEKLGDMSLYREGNTYARRICRALVAAVGGQAAHAARNRKNRKARRNAESETVEITGTIQGDRREAPIDDVFAKLKEMHRMMQLCALVDPYLECEALKVLELKQNPVSLRAWGCEVSYRIERAIEETVFRATVRRLEEMELIFCSTDLIKRKVWAITEKGRRALKEIGI